MPTNEQRRATAKRKLERQLERRAAKARRQRLLTIIGSAVAVVAVIAVVVAVFVLRGDDSADETASPSDATGTADTGAPATELATGGPGQLPAFNPPADLGADCQYPTAPPPPDPTAMLPADKQVDPPRTGTIPTDVAQVSASMTTNQGNIGLMLDNAKAPCTVNSFASLAQQGYFDETPCHRATDGPGLWVLQCGDPTGTGMGGPGYQFDNEYPTNQYQPDDPALQEPVTYPRGTLAMANAGANTNGSQFFLVYQDSQLPPGYTVFGTIDETGLATLDQIAEAGVVTRGQVTAPVADVQIETVRLD